LITIGKEFIKFLQLCAVNQVTIAIIKTKYPAGAARPDMKQLPCFPVDAYATAVLRII